MPSAKGSGFRGSKVQRFCDGDTGYRILVFFICGGVRGL